MFPPGILTPSSDAIPRNSSLNLEPISTLAQHRAAISDAESALKALKFKKEFEEVVNINKITTANYVPKRASAHVPLSQLVLFHPPKYASPKELIFKNDLIVTFSVYHGFGRKALKAQQSYQFLASHVRTNLS